LDTSATVQSPIPSKDAVWTPSQEEVAPTTFGLSEEKSTYTMNAGDDASTEFSGAKRELGGQTTVSASAAAGGDGVQIPPGFEGSHYPTYESHKNAPPSHSEVYERMAGYNEPGALEGRSFPLGTDPSYISSSYSSSPAKSKSFPWFTVVIAVIVIAAVAFFAYQKYFLPLSSSSFLGSPDEAQKDYTEGPTSSEDTSSDDLTGNDEMDAPDWGAASLSQTSKKGKNETREANNNNDTTSPEGGSSLSENDSGESDEQWEQQRQQYVTREELAMALHNLVHYVRRETHGGDDEEQNENQNDEDDEEEKIEDEETGVVSSPLEREGSEINGFPHVPQEEQQKGEFHYFDAEESSRGQNVGFSDTDEFAANLRAKHPFGNPPKEPPADIEEIDENEDQGRSQNNPSYSKDTRSEIPPSPPEPSEAHTNHNETTNERENRYSYNDEEEM
jgi:hypothetical protein